MNPGILYDEQYGTGFLSKKKVKLDWGLLRLRMCRILVSSAVNRTKTGKSYLDIPNDVMKNENAKKVLHRFLDLCFRTGLSPIEWNLSNIKPIPKPEKDRRDPLQNRCISIMCCVAKLYSSILTTRLQKYLEKNVLLVDEQNGFRSKRSCIDHLFTLVTVLRNRKEH